MLRCAPHSCSEDSQKNRALVTAIPATIPAEHITPKPNGTKQTDGAEIQTEHAGGGLSAP